MGQQKFYAQRNFQARGIDLFLSRYLPGTVPTQRHDMKGVWTEMPEGESGGPLVTLRTEEAQDLMDELWACGLRPTEGTGSAGSLAATQKHLEDMRRIVNVKLNVDLP